MKSSLPPTHRMRSPQFSPARLRAFFAAIIALIFVGAPQPLPAATATLTMQDSSFPTQFNSGGDFYNSGANALGMWANQNNTAKQTVGWANLSTSGFVASGGSARNLQIGDVFTITVSATRAFGQIGFSLNAGGTQGTSYANSLSGSRMYISTDNYAAWSVKGLSGGSTASLSYVPIENTYKDYRFTIRLTSQTTADVFLTVDGTDYRAYNLTLAGSAGANISALSIFGSDMWDGSSNDDAFWKQTSTIQDTGRVELGYFQGSSGTFTPGIITDGITATSTSTSVANEVFVGGDGAVVLNQANTYTGATTVNSGATARAQNATAFGTTAGGVSVTSGGMVELSGGITVGNEALTLNGSGVSSAGALRNTSGNNSWAGAITLGSASRINSDAGTLTLDVASGNAISGAFNLTFGGSGNVTINDPIATSTGSLTKDGNGVLSLAAANTYTGATTINAGTLSVSADNNLGTAPGSATPGHLTLGGGTLSVTTGFTLDSNRGISFTTSTTSFLSVAASQTLSYGGVMAGSGTLVKSGTGDLALSGSSSSYSGGVSIEAGTLNFIGGSLGSGTALGVGDAAGSATAATFNMSGNSLSTARNVDIRGGGSSGTRTLNFANATGTTNTISGTISHTNKAFTINVANSGATALLSGLISNTGGGPTISVTGNGTAAVSNTGNTTDARWSIGSGATLAIGASRNLGADSTALYPDKITLAGGTLRATNGFQLSNFGIQVTSASTISVDSGLAMTNPAVMGGTADITKAGSGTLVLGGANTNAGNWMVTEGVLSVSAANNLSTNPASGVTNRLTLNGGTLAVTTGFTANANAGITVGASGGAVNVAESHRLIQAGGLYGTGNFIKTGLGTLSLTNTSGAYAGAITVTNGTLQANTALRGANVSVGNSSTLNGSVLMGAGQVGSVIIETNGRISPGNSVGVLSVSDSLTFNGGGSYLWEITNAASGAPGTNWDLITVDTTAVNNGLGTLTIGGSGQFTVNGDGAGIANFSNSQNYTNDYFLIVSAANISGSLANLAFSGTGLGTGAWTFSSNSTGLFLNYTAPGTTWVFNNSVAADQGTASTTTNGNTLNQLATITNEGGGVTAVIISNSAPMTFTNTDNSYSGTTIIEQGTLVAGVNAPNAANGAFGNAATAIQVGSTNTGNSTTATLLIGNPGVTVGRAITVNSGGTGQRSIGATNASGTATYSGNIAANTNVTLSASNSGGTTLFSGVLSGSGAVTAAGNGIVVLSGANTYTNTTAVNSGSTLVAANNAALGGGSGDTTVASGGTLAFSNNINEDEAITISGTGVGGLGALRNISGANTNTGTVALAANALIAADAGSLRLGNINNGAVGTQLTFSNASGSTILLTGNLANMDTTSTFFKTGLGSLVISNSGATVGGGQLQLGAGSVTLAAGTFSTNAGTGTRGVDLGLTSGNAGSAFETALYANSGVTMSNSVYVAGGSGARILGTESGTGTATFNNEIFLDRGSSESVLNLYANTGGTALFSGVLRTNNVGAGGFATKTGGGTVILSAINTAVGTLTIGEGTLAISNGQAIANVNSVVISNVAGATLRVDTGETIAGLSGGGATGGTVTLNAQLRSRFDSASNNFAGTITGTSSFLKGGTGSLTLSGANSFAGGTTHEAGTLIIGNITALGSGVYQVDFGNSTNKTIAANGTASFTLSQSNNIFNDLTIGEATGNTGSLNLSGGTWLGDLNGPRVLTVNGMQTLSGGITGANGLTKAGSGTLVLSGSSANTFSGATTINDGTLLLQKTAGVNALAGTPTINNGGTLRLGASDQFAGDSTFLTINSGGTFDLDGFNDSLALTGSGNITLGSGRLTLNPVNSDTFSGVISGAGSVVKTNTGTQILSGNNTYTGGTLVAQGTLRIGAGGTTGSIGGNITNNATVTFNRSDNLTYAGVMSGTGSLQKWGAGVLTLSGSNTVSGANHFLLDGTTLFAVNQGAAFGGTLNIGNTSGSDSSTLALSNGITLTNSVSVRTGSSGTMTIASQSTNAVDTLTGSLTLSKNADIRAASGGGLLVNGNITGDFVLAKRGAGTVTLAGTTAGGTRFDLWEGELQIGSAGNLGNSSTAINNKIYFDSGTLAATGTFTIGSNNGMFVGGGGAGFRVASGNTLTVAAAIDNGATNVITKLGDGTLTLTSTSNSGNNRFDLLAGELQVSAVGNLGDKTGPFLGNKLFFNGGALGVTGTMTLDGENGITLGGNGTIRVATGNTLTLQGYINDGSSTGLTLSKTGAGTLFFDKTGVNDFSGTTIVVNEGAVSTWNPGLLSSTVELGSSTAATSGTYIFTKTDGGVTAGNNFTVNSGGGAIRVTDNTLTVSGVLGGNGAFSKTGAGNLTLTGNSTYNGNLTVSAGTLELNRTGGAALGSVDSITVASGAVLLLSQSSQVNSASADVTLSGGTIRRAGSVSEVFGSLNLTTGSFLDYGTGAVGSLEFGSYAPGALLTVQNFGEGNSLKFGNDISSFLPTGGNLSNSYFSFNNAFTYNATTFTITAIPEPSAYVAAAGLLAMFLWPARRRLMKDAKSILGLRAPARERFEGYRNV